MNLAPLPAAAPQGCSRRGWLALLAATACGPGAADAREVAPRRLAFPRDFGAHLAQRIEWWYVTGWLAAAAAGAPEYGFQVTFFRALTGTARSLGGRFAGRQLLFAHAALTDLGARRLRHAERLARWNEDPRAVQAAAGLEDTRVHIGDWRLSRDDAGPGGLYQAAVSDPATGFALRARLATSQSLLLQGQAGFSRKGPHERHASHYYSQPHLAVDGTLALDGREHAVRGRAWLDHEWSDSLMPEDAVGWDWIGINLDDGGALTAFRLRDAQGRAVWSGGSHRSRGGVPRTFGADEVGFVPLAWWTSAATAARYPVRWRVTCPAGTFEVAALLDAQELDARTSTGTVYWEGLSELRADGGARIGLGYLEMTGYASALRLGG